jgi:Uma2 family endonuclease
MAITLEPLKRKGVYTAEDIDNLPESDGVPMAETHAHVLQMVGALDALLHHFRDDPNIYLIGNMFVYFLNADGYLKRVAPDIFAVHGVSKEPRRVYHVPNEGKAPEVAIEFTSKKTRNVDLYEKPDIYSRLGVREYFMFDPLGDYLDPQLIGFRLVREKYVQMDKAQPRLRSKVLGLDLVAEDNWLRFYDAATGEKLLTHEEAHAARELAEAQTQREVAARQREAEARQAAELKAQRALAAQQAAEAEVLRLREELARLQKS